MEESIIGQRHANQHTKKPNSLTLNVDMIIAKEDILGEELHRVHHFKYIVSSVDETGYTTTAFSQRVSAACENWKKCSGVLCDRRMSVKLKGKVYKTEVRPALLYAETWATTRGQEERLEVNEMRMLRWMCGVTRRDQIRNEHIRGTTRVV